MTTINKITVPSVLFRSYLKKSNLKPNDLLDDEKIEAIHALAAKDYKNKRISIVEFSKICNFMFSKLSDDSVKTGTLGKKLLAASKVN